MTNDERTIGLATRVHPYGLRRALAVQSTNVACTAKCTHPLRTALLLLGKLSRFERRLRNGAERN